MNQKKLLKCILSGVLALMLILPLYATAFAADATMEIPVVKVVTGGNPETPETFTFELSAVSNGAPMPSGSEDGKKLITITGSNRGSFGSIAFSSAGTYVYSVKEKAGSNSHYQYDTSVYTITIYVRSTVEGLKATITIREKDAEEKSSEVLFTNKYTAPTDPTDPTPTDPDPTDPVPTDPVPTEPTSVEPTVTTPVTDPSETTTDKNGGVDSGDWSKTDPYGDPKTGDTGNPTLWLAMLYCAVIALAFLVIIGARRRKADENE